MSDYGTIVHAEEGLVLWPQRRPSISTRGAHVGRVVLSDSHLLFLVTAGLDGARSVLARVIVGPSSGGAPGGAHTRELDLRALQIAGSLTVPLVAITAVSAQRRCDRATYVAVQYHDDTRAIREVSFMPKTSTAWAGAQRWADRIGTAQKQLRLIRPCT